MNVNLSRPCLCVVLDHFTKINARQACNVMYPLGKVLLLAGAACDDREDIRLDCRFPNAHLALLRGFAEFHFGIPCADWLRSILNRIDPDLFMDRQLLVVS